MYTRERQLHGMPSDICNYIDDIDVYDSTLIADLINPSIIKIPYEITRFDYRPDLIAKDFYGSESYLPYVILQTGKDIEEFTKGSTIYLTPKSVIDEIINGIY